MTLMNIRIVGLPQEAPGRDRPLVPEIETITATETIEAITTVAMTDTTVAMIETMTDTTVATIEIMTVAMIETMGTVGIATTPAAAADSVGAILTFPVGHAPLLVGRKETAKSDPVAAAVHAGLPDAALLLTPRSELRVAAVQTAIAQAAAVGVAARHAVLRLEVPEEAAAGRRSSKSGQ